MPVNNIIQGTASGVVLDVDTNSVGNVGGGEDDLIVSTIPANTLDVDHKYIHFSASGQFATSINNKQLRAYFGSTKIFDSGSLAITSVSDWILEGWIIRISATSEHALVKFECSSNVLSAFATYSTPTEDLTLQVILKCTGAGTSDNDITQTDLIVDVNNGGTGLGDVSGPSSSVDGHFASFNGTTGKIIKDGTQPTTIANDLIWSARGQLAIGVGSATGTVLPVGTGGQILTVNTGTSSGLQWATSSGGSGALTYLASYTSNSGSSINVTSILSSLYDTYMFDFIGIIPTTTNKHFILRMSTDNGGTWDNGSNYDWAIMQQGTGGQFNQQAGGQSYIRISHDVNNTSNWSTQGQVWVSGVNSSSLYKETNSHSLARSSDNNTYQNIGAGVYKITTVVNAIQFLFDTGTITGTIRVYGVKPS